MFASEREVGRYVLRDLIGRGGAAEVFAGHANGLHGFQKPVAIKRLSPDLASDRVFVERLIAEARVLVAMHHGNIVGVLDVARDDTDLFVVMEYVDGPSLRQLLDSRSSRPIPLGIATYIAQSAAAGLEYAHGQLAVVHADVRPSNLLLTTSGEVRVADFGLARRREGIVAYMAPEQVAGEPPSRAWDVYSLGAVIYELVMDHPSLTPGLWAICMRARAADPRERFARMQDLLDALADERFRNHWCEGPNELAQAIREIATSRRQTLETSRPIAVMTSSLIAPTVIVDPAVETDGRARWPHAKRNPMFAAWLPSPELATVHHENSAATTHHRRSPIRAWMIVALVCSVALGTFVFFAVRGARRSPERDTRSARRGHVVAFAPSPPPVRAPMPVLPIIEADPPKTEPSKIADVSAEPPPVVEVADASPAPDAEPTIRADNPPPASAAPRAKAELRKRPAADATLRVNTIRADAVWAFASLDGARQEVPGAKFKVTPGRRVVKLENPERELALSCTVTLVSNRTVSLNVDLETGRCQVTAAR